MRRECDHPGPTVQDAGLTTFAGVQLHKREASSFAFVFPVAAVRYWLMKSISHGQISTNAAPAKGLAPSSLSVHTHHCAAWVGIWVGNRNGLAYVSHGLMTDKPAAS